MYECNHNKKSVNCPECGAPEVETLTYAEAEKVFKIPEQTIRAAVRNNSLTEIPGQKARILAGDIRKLVNDSRIGRGPGARTLKRKRF